MEPFFSIVIPLYNKEASITNTVKSVLNQTFKHFEVVVINDGSTDDSASLVKSIQDPRVRLYGQANSGVSAARNLGFKKAKCQHVCLLDADDLWESTFLETIYNLVLDYPECGLYCTNYKYLLSDGEIKSTKFKCVPLRGVVNDYYKAVSRNKASGLTSQSSICVKKEAFESVGGYPEGVTHTEDVLFCSLISHKYKVAYVDQVLATYRLNAENRTNNNKPTGERYVVEVLSKDLSNKAIQYRYLSSFIGKHILHTASNCIEVDDKKMFKLHMGDKRLNFLALSPYYKLVFLLFNALPFRILSKLL